MKSTAHHFPVGMQNVFWLQSRDGLGEAGLFHTPACKIWGDWGLKGDVFLCIRHTLPIEAHKEGR